MSGPLTQPVRLAAGAAALVACAVLGAVAAAAPGDGAPGSAAHAGSATAAAVVDGSARLVRGRNVESVRAPGTGVVCVRLAAGITPDTVVPLVTAVRDGDGPAPGAAAPPALAVLVHPARACDGAHEVEVATHDADGRPARAGFTLVVP
ncbi:hypothetical protein ACL02R_10135 [Streptomyces sp. MS19]|uniref:hypothetical protein n=1 Tax=Streptomyces sp. MS19 TaxID=3385972 RepID=UPI0039A3999F